MRIRWVGHVDRSEEKIHRLNSGSGSVNLSHILVGEKLRTSVATWIVSEQNKIHEPKTALENI